MAKEPTTPPRQPPGLRELKKQQTRQAISDTATDLFLARGFEAVTIAEIAAAAQVAKMTVTNYFPRKEDLALDLREEFVGSLARTVAERAVGESALAALRREFLAAVERRDPVIGFAGPEFTGMIVESPALTARLREFHELREAALAERLAEETAAADGDMTPQAAAAQLGGAHRVLFAETVRRTMAGEDTDSAAGALATAAERVFGFLEPSLAGYAIRES